MTKKLDHFGQLHLIAEAAIVGAGEFVAEQAYKGIDRAGYQIALEISRNLTGLEKQREEFLSTLRLLDEAIATDISATPNPINMLVEKLNQLTAQITSSKARAQLR